MALETEIVNGTTVIVKEIVDSSTINFLGALLGGAISGVIGIFVVRYKVKQDSKKELVDTAYRPWLSQMKKRDLNKINSGDEKAPIWMYPRNFDDYLISKLDKNVKKIAEENFKIGEEYNVFVMQFAQDYSRNENEIVSILQKAFQDNDLIDESGKVKFSRLSVTEWVGFFKYPILAKNIKDENDLLTKLFEQAEIHEDTTTFPVWLKRIKEKQPEFFSSLFSLLPSAREKIIIKINDDDLAIKRKILFQKYEELMKVVLKKCK